MTQWGQEMTKEGGDKAVAITDEDMRRMTVVTEEMTKCMTKAMTAGMAAAGR
jgi:hypothetical protein